MSARDIRNTPEWEIVKDMIEVRLREHRQRIESTSLDDRKRFEVVCRIAELKDLVSAVEKPKTDAPPSNAPSIY